MIELPEALTLARELEVLTGKTVEYVLPPTKPHKFCWFNGDAAEYGERIAASTVAGARAFGIYVELAFSNGNCLCVNDGVNMRYVDSTEKPKDFQLLIGFTDGTSLVFTVAMYGGIVLHDDSYDNGYYLKSKNGVSPFDASFADYYAKKLSECKPSLSAKAFIATEQSFPGVGNGVAQDILFAAGINPKRKIASLPREKTDALREAMVVVLREMTEKGGRDTEKDLYGRSGGYTTKMSKNALAAGCGVCGCGIVKESFLGGSVYYCPNCQKL